MLKFLARAIVAISLNVIGFWLMSQYISGFILKSDILTILSVATLFTILNFVVRPILKLFLGPLIVLTLGVGVILVNVVLLYILDIVSKNLTIETIPALLYASIIVGILNVIFHLATKNK